MLSRKIYDDIYNVSKKFFDLPVAQKQKYAASKDSEIFDLQGFGSDSIGVNIDGEVLDWSYRLYLLNETVEERKLQYWHADDSPLHFRRKLDEYRVHARSVSEIILKAMAKSLGL
ncbi:hypothetical protein MKX01_032821 [Papaver californicum]|nr:hypothetical protein MKX01_032821 [Papaver californicum]